MWDSFNWLGAYCPNLVRELSFIIGRGALFYASLGKWALSSRLPGFGYYPYIHLPHPQKKILNWGIDISSIHPICYRTLIFHYPKIPLQGPTSRPCVKKLIPPPQINVRPLTFFFPSLSMLSILIKGLRLKGDENYYPVSLQIIFCLNDCVLLVQLWEWRHKKLCTACAIPLDVRETTQVGYQTRAKLQRSEWRHISASSRHFEASIQGVDPCICHVMQLVTSLRGSARVARVQNTAVFVITDVRHSLRRLTFAVCCLLPTSELSPELPWPVAECNPLSICHVMPHDQGSHYTSF